MAVETIIAGQVPLGKGGIIASPFQFATGGEDMLRLRLWASAIRVISPGWATFRISIRHVALDGSLQLTNQTLTTDTDTVAKTLLIPLPAGFLQTVSVTWAGAAVTTVPGLVYGVVDLVRGTQAGAQLVTGQLLGGYLGPGQALSWPGMPIVGPLEGPGYHGSITFQGTLGAELLVPALQGIVWRVRSLQVQFTAGATVANRRPHLQLFDPTTHVMLIPYPADVVATAQVNVTYAPGQPAFSGTANFSGTAPMPPGLMMRFGDFVRTLTIGLQADDLYNKITLCFDAYLEPLP